MMIEAPDDGAAYVNVTWTEPDDLKNEVVDDENDERPNAYVTLCWNDSNVLATLVLFQQLRRVNSARGNFVIISTKLSAESKRQFEKFGVRVIMIPATLNGPIGYAMGVRGLAGRDSILWTKLYLWTLTDYRKILLLDTDMVIVKNIDALFDYEELAGSPMLTPKEKILYFEPRPDPPAEWIMSKWRGIQVEQKQNGVGKIGLNSGLMILRPSMRRFQHMRALLGVLRNRPCCPTQEFFYRYFENLGKYVRLPPEYHVRCLKRMQNKTEAMELRKRTLVYHYVGPKPWRRDYSKVKDSLILYWKEVADDITAWLAGPSLDRLPDPSKYAAPDPARETWREIVS